MNWEYGTLMMLRRLLSVFCITVTVLATTGAKPVDSLTDIQWENRIILVEGASSPGEVVKRLQRYRRGIADRDILWFVVADGGIESNMDRVTEDLAQSVRADFESRAAGAKVLLIGKDGRVKARSNELDLERLFSEIDQMPLRVMEMREKRDRGDTE